ncbi:hypothetical protein [Deinococcus marmoris]|uniref:Uncharacterized protein n=1 Tax=Deinococcus marmoris TaxID=249408 RepID=A0A1U7NXZ5_9DEIO|nr:hypothetical protein [Deinococcus marmoris]OLV17788.1 hypothetical protein BOO71_0007804 [Deinococcus marmoris]
MNLDDYRRPSPTRLRLYLSLLLMLVLTAILGKKRDGDLGTVETLKRSSFARIMFMDIGALSTLGALYLALNGKSRVRIPAALASLAVGSFSLLPALAYEDWKAMQNAEGENQTAKR